MEQSLNDLISFYQNKIEELHIEIRQMNDQRIKDWQIALEFRGYAHRMILYYVNMYRRDRLPFYIDSVKDMKAQLEAHNDSGESTINRFRINLIEKCDEAIAEMEAL